jgi:hypothetical protein
MAHFEHLAVTIPALKVSTPNVGVGGPVRSIKIADHETLKTNITYSSSGAIVGNGSILNLKWTVPIGDSSMKILITYSEELDYNDTRPYILINANPLIGISDQRIDIPSGGGTVEQIVNVTTTGLGEILLFLVVPSNTEGGTATWLVEIDYTTSASIDGNNIIPLIPNLFASNSGKICRSTGGIRL